jgi:predicted O-methyltransferase YrrM
MRKNIQKIAHLIQSEIDKFRINQADEQELQIFKMVINSHKKFLESEAFSTIVQSQSNLKNETKEINYYPFDTKTLTVSEIFNRAASPSFWGAFFRSLVVSGKAKAVLELGTNLGVGTQYFLDGLNFNDSVGNNLMVTIEGVHDIADFSNSRLKQIINEANYKVKLHNLKGSFEDLQNNVNELNIKFDIVFIDGDHTYEGTMKYWEIYKETFAQNCIVIFDDIYCGSGMLKAWNELKTKPEAKISIDLFKLGIVFFDRNNQKKSKQYHYHLSF